MKVKFKKLVKDLELPEYMTDGSAGADVHILIPGMGSPLAPGETRRFRTGLSVEIPKGYEIQIRSRSSLALNGIVVVNSPATIDSDYRGEIFVILRNHSNATKHFIDQERVAQFVLNKVDQIEWIDSELVETKRGTKGLGSTGQGVKK